ncbi:MAG TPA: hypothetical protein VM452_04980 [Caulifigura sp.]|jgi:hypothetical protein|nr:hypothetical protein [Caulifigura sp.]
MWIFEPAIWKGGSLWQLPRPVAAIRLADSWDFEKYKTPLADGDLVTGHSRNGLDVQLEGQIGHVAGSLRIDENAMLLAMLNLRTRLDVDNAAGRFRLVLYRNTSTGQSRYFEKCSTVRFESDLSDPRLISYSVLIHASSPELQTGALEG